MNEPEALKVVLLGESGVGKTSIISQFTTNKFNPRCSTSVSAQFISKTVDFPELGQSIKFDIWDTAGQEKYRSLAKIFYKDAKVIIFVYDITTQYSFKGIKEYWYDETKNHTDNNPIFALVANKNDLYAEQQVNNKEGQEFADEIGAIFQTTSALSDMGINTLFENIGKKYFIPNFDYKSGDQSAQEEYVKKQQEEKESSKRKKSKNIKLDKNKAKNVEKKNRCCG